MKRRSPLARNKKGFRARFEALEERRLLSVNDLLITTYDSFYGTSVYRYNEVTHTPTSSGGVATGGSENVGTTTGVAVDTDGSFWVSSNAESPGEVLHYNADGTFDGVLGENDAPPFSSIDPFFFPGHLEFGPNGHLYVASLYSATIYEFDTSVSSPQFVGYQFLGYGPGGFTWATDGSDDLIVGSLSDHSVRRYTDEGEVVLFQDDDDDIDDNINPGAIVALPNNDLLITDFTFGGDEGTHNRIVKYDDDAVGIKTSTFHTFSDPIGTGLGYEGFPAEPTPMILDHDGNLLVGISPDHSLNGAIVKIDINTGAQIGDFLITGIGSPTGLAFTQSLESSVAGRHLFYNQSAFDGNDASIAAADDGAIATDKTAYLPGSGTAGFTAVSAYTRGINGIMVDLAGGGDHASITASDFVFKTGNNNSPADWTVLATAPTISVRPGDGDGGSDRVEITWPAGTISNKWLEVQVLANSRTGLAASDVHFWGNLIGETGSGTASTFAVLATTDVAVITGALGGGKPITDLSDIDKSGATLATTDRATVVGNLGGSISRINIAGGGPFAPGGGAAPTSTSSVIIVSGGDAGIASALAGSGSTLPSAAAPLATVARLDSSSPPDAGASSAYYAQLADGQSPFDAVGDESHLDDDLLDALASETIAG